MSSFSRSKYRSVEVIAGPALVPTIGWTALAVLTQTMFAGFATFHATVPSLVTIAVVLYTTRAGLRRGALLGIIAGLLEDSFAGSGGAWTVALTLTAVFVGTIARGFFSDGFPMLGALVALAVLVRDAVFWAVMRIEGYPDGLGIPHFHAALWQALLSGACTIIYLVARARFVADRTDVERYP